MSKNMIAVVPIAYTKVNWDVFKKLTFNATRRNIRAAVDGQKQTNEINEYISSLSEFREEGSNYLDSLRNAGSLLDHASVTMLCAIPDTLLITMLIEMNLSVVRPRDLYENLIIMSGSLSQWRTAIINLGCPKSREYSIACKTFLDAFDSIGLSQIFENYSRKTDSNGGLLLTLK